MYPTLCKDPLEYLHRKILAKFKSIIHWSMMIAVIRAIILLHTKM